MTIDPHPREEDELDSTATTLMEHLVELRRRLLYAVAALLVAVAACYTVAPEIYQFLVQPLADVFADQNGEVRRRLIYTSLTETFFTYLKVALFAGFFLTFPVIISQMWLFIAPGLYKTEKRAFLPFLVATPVLFLAGAAMAYYVVFPLAWSFFVGFEVPAVAGALPI